MELPDRAARRLKKNTIGWLTTVRQNGLPQTSPVWYLWDGDHELLVYSLAGTARTANIEANPRVSFHLDSDGHGDDIVTLEGTAQIDGARPPANEAAAYVDKYKGYMNASGWTPDWFAGRYPVPLVIHIDRVRAH